MVLSIAYFPPVEFFAHLAGDSPVLLEAHEHYCKQSWRNRCRILTAGGPMDLNVPVVHDGDIFHKEIKDIKVDYTTDWVRRTEYAIESAYSSSPFFIYYRDQLFAILESHIPTLWELDMAIIRFFCDKVGIAQPAETGEYAGIDLDIHPKRPSGFGGRPYWQVFKEKFGFVPNLSIMDLLFNEGPEAICYLK